MDTVTFTCSRRGSNPCGRYSPFLARLVASPCGRGFQTTNTPVEDTDVGQTSLIMVLLAPSPPRSWGGFSGSLWVLPGSGRRCGCLPQRQGLSHADLSPCQDESNRSGGKWIIRLRKGLASRFWENIILAMLGEQFMVGEEICGAVVSIRFQVALN